MIDTGEPRSVTGHVVSGAIASASIAGGINYNQYKKEQVSKQEAIHNTLKLSAQGAVATGAAIATANYLGKGNLLGVLGALSLGVTGVYAIEKISEKTQAAKKLEDTEELTIGEIDG